MPALTRLPLTPVTEGLVRCSSLMLEELLRNAPPETRQKFRDAYLDEIREAELINARLDAITEQLGSYEDEPPATPGDITTIINNRVGGTYHLQIGGPRVACRPSTSWFRLGCKIQVAGAAEENRALCFPWTAAGAVEAQWRLVFGSTVILSGSRLAPFGETIETVTDAVAAMPAAGDEVEFQVRYGSADSSLIGLVGPGTWEVR